MSEIEMKIDEIMTATRNAKVIHPQPYDGHMSYRLECMKHTKNSGGLWLEFGVFRGCSLNHLAKIKPNEKFFGFDSFEGLPEDWDSDNLKGAFNLNGNIPIGAITGSNQGTIYDTRPTINTVPWEANVTLVKGWFNETLPPFLQQHKENIDFIHFDADLYSSTKTVFDLVSSRIISGTMIMFDEHCDYPTYREHEIKAFAEFLLATKHKYTCVVYQPSTYSQACFIIE
jgi:hypothetical protein